MNTSVIKGMEVVKESAENVIEANKANILIVRKRELYAIKYNLNVS